MEEVVFSKYTVDFVRVSLEYCALVEKAHEQEKEVFVDNAVKVLPLLYLKASIIPEIEDHYDSYLEIKVTEDLYSGVQTKIEELLGEDNLYLETFHPDIRMSDSPVAVRISEDLADIYQDLGNFIAVFKNGNKETMNDSLVACIGSFKEYWGQRLVNALRALHYIKYKEKESQWEEQ
ncbi:MAG: DUF5063 domain-containing protein [Dysgonamonadaceae bacterium]|jgi:hypothetical protein|nr:DUF5063 domain-containing protein [Dysgonamonadaceae bacterium]